MPICGPNCSLCCAVLAAWGVVQLGLMGLFYYLHSPAFIEDLPLPAADNETAAGLDEFYEKVDDAYTQTALNCWIAAGMYIVVLAISLQQLRANIVRS